MLLYTTIRDQGSRGAERELQQTREAPGHHRVRAHKPKKALHEFKQARVPPLLHFAHDVPQTPRRPPQQPPIPPRRPRKPHPPRDLERQPKLPVPLLDSVLRRPPHLPHRARHQLQ